ncbi:MAG TPA: zf-HC2 domain-containing protein [Elusimicrobiota bacterium]|nr:zf-HC2 domain-containing protein [Elusimicrobiota bacterium]
MEHDKIVERLSEYRDGALSAPEREAVARHLSGCAECSSVLADWERLSRAFFRPAPAPTPFQTEAFVARVTARLPAGAASAAPSWLSGRWLVPALGLSVAALAFTFRPYSAAEVSDPAVALLASPDGAALSAAAQPETSGADILSPGAEER